MHVHTCIFACIDVGKQAPSNKRTPLNLVSTVYMYRGL